MKKRILLTVLLIVPGMVVAAVCSYYALQDWAALGAAYRHFHTVAGTNADFQAVSIAYWEQDIHRINLFVDGVWALLGAVLVGIGLHGLCVMREEGY